MNKIIGLFLLLSFCFAALPVANVHAEEGRNSWTATFTRTAEEKGLDAAVKDALLDSHSILEILMASSFAGFSDGAILTALSHCGVENSLIIAAAKNSGMSMDIITAALNQGKSSSDEELGYSEALSFNPPALPSRIAVGNTSHRSVSQATF